MSANWKAWLSGKYILGCEFISFYIFGPQKKSEWALQLLVSFSIFCSFFSNLFFVQVAHGVPGRWL